MQDLTRSAWSLNIEFGIPWFVTNKGAVGFTLGNTAFFDPSKFYTHSARGLGLIGHEALHASDFKRLGVVPMAARYLGEYGINRLRMDGTFAYENISFEVRAKSLQNKIEFEQLVR